MTRSSLFLAILLGSALLSAQHSHPAAPPGEKPVELLGHLGPYSHRIATTHPEAQKFFDQGLNLMYGFNRYEALRSFRKAAELDPRAPMPLWGIAMALGPHINMDMDADTNLKEGCAALSTASTLPASPYEKDYLAAAASRCPEYQPDPAIDAFRKLHQQYPDDPDAAALYAESVMVKSRWKWWRADGTPADGMAQAVEVLEQVMRRNPNHPGANHFYIHAVEMSPSPERAVPSAQRLMAIMPAAGHMVHMPGHIWVILGEWETAADVNERAAQVDREYFARTGVQSGYLGYYLHNVHFIAYARGMQGRSQQAISAADLMLKESAPMVESMPEMLDAFAPYAIFMRLRFQRWDELLALPKPHSKLLATTALWHWARALSFAGKGDKPAGAREAALFQQARAKVPPQWPWMTSKSVNVLAMADAILQARYAPGPAAAISHWRSAVELQDALNYDEPPPWYMPLRESLGAALLLSGDAAGAEAVFREGARRSVRNGRMLFGLTKSLEAQHKQEAAEFVRREYEREWKAPAPALRLEDM
ncbi:tetratricopeptide repeat protein [Paludibaculum fermentans]|uniref:tetratricopeptide repeat protein n=1 Tax=Paludibaculum fermentans TaxID=1473598 RepID=UPI003EBDA627